MDKQGRHPEGSREADRSPNSRVLPEDLSLSFSNPAGVVFPRVFDRLLYSLPNSSDKERPGPFRTT